MVDGKLSIDHSSTVVSRTTFDGSLLEANEEDERTRLVNSATYGKRQKSDRWGYEETEKFYEGLTKFGTDFEMLAKWIKTRTRRMIRAKFKREERIDPGRVTEALR
ncbi:hypothetical protein BJ508DRAFT_213956, partial [Ascobolus immersus RN42]